MTEIVHWPDYVEERPREGSPGRFIGRHKNGARYIDCSREYLERALTDALEAVQKIPHGDVVPLDCAEELRIAAEALDNISYHMPRVECWTVCRPAHKNSSFSHSVWNGCFSEDQAKALAEAWTRKERGHGRYVGHENARPWIVEWGVARLSAVLAPNADVEEFVRRSGAFS